MARHQGADDALGRPGFGHQRVDVGLGQGREVAVGRARARGPDHVPVGRRVALEEADRRRGPPREPVRDRRRVRVVEGVRDDAAERRRRVLAVQELLERRPVADVGPEAQLHALGVARRARREDDNSGVRLARLAADGLGRQRQVVVARERRRRVDDGRLLADAVEELLRHAVVDEDDQTRRRRHLVEAPLHRVRLPVHRHGHGAREHRAEAVHEVLEAVVREVVDAGRAGPEAVLDEHARALEGELHEGLARVERPIQLLVGADAQVLDEEGRRAVLEGGEVGPGRARRRERRGLEGRHGGELRQKPAPSCGEDTSF